MLLAIDPGADTGWALFDSARRLKACGLGTPDPVPMGSLDAVLIECPRLRPKGEKNPNAILLLARNAGEWGGRYESYCEKVAYLTPNEWKGSTPKDIQHARDSSKLDAIEQLIVAKAGKGMAPSKRHNMLDAIGIGLHGVGR